MNKNPIEIMTNKLKVARARNIAADSSVSIRNQAASSTVYKYARKPIYVVLFPFLNGFALLPIL